MSMIPDHYESIQGLIPEQYKRADKLNGLIASVMSGCDDVETMLQELRDIWDIDLMEGVNLDIIGSLFGVSRNGMDDQSYRELIKAGPVESGVPTMETLRALVKITTGSENVGLYPFWPAGVYVVVETDGRDLLSGKMEKWVASGVDPVLGTFLCHEDNHGVYIVSEDNGMPFVIDQAFYTPSTIYELITDTGDGLVDENGDGLAALDF